jgi:hypothetical protein
MIFLPPLASGIGSFIFALLLLQKRYFPVHVFWEFLLLYFILTTIQYGELIRHSEIPHFY